MAAAWAESLPPEATAWRPGDYALCYGGCLTPRARDHIFHKTYEDPESRMLVLAGICLPPNWKVAVKLISRVKACSPSREHPHAISMWESVDAYGVTYYVALLDKVGPHRNELKRGFSK